MTHSKLSASHQLQCFPVFSGANLLLLFKSGKLSAEKIGTYIRLCPLRAPTQGIHGILFHHDSTKHIYIARYWTALLVSMHNSLFHGTIWSPCQSSASTFGPTSANWKPSSNNLLLTSFLIAKLCYIVVQAWFEITLHLSDFIPADSRSHPCFLLSLTSFPHLRTVRKAEPPYHSRPGPLSWLSTYPTTRWMANVEWSQTYGFPCAAHAE